MNVDSTDGPPKELRQLKNGLPSLLMATSLLSLREGALRSTYRFRLTSHSRSDLIGNSFPETDRGRKLGGIEVGGTKKGGMAPLLFCDVVPAEFSAVGVTDQYPRVIAAR